MKIFVKTVALCLFLLSGSAYSADMSPARKFKWSHEDFCTKTISSYIDSYNEGEKEFVQYFISENQFFSELTPPQKKSFLSLIDYYFEIYKNNGSKEGSVSQCVTDLEKSINALSLENHSFCSNISHEVISKMSNNGNIYSLKVRESEKNKFPNIVYQECMSKVIKTNIEGIKFEK